MHKELRALYQSDEIFRCVVDCLASRKKYTRKTDVDRVATTLCENFGKGVTRADLSPYFEKFQTLGLGNYEVSKKVGDHYRFNWSADFNYIDLMNQIKGTNALPGSTLRVILNLSSGKRISLSGAEIQELRQLFQQAG